MGARDTEPKLVVIDGNTIAVTSPKQAKKMLAKMRSGMDGVAERCNRKVYEQLVGYLCQKADQVEKLKREVARLKPAGDKLEQLLIQHGQLESTHTQEMENHDRIVSEYLEVAKGYSELMERHGALKAKHVNLQDRYLQACQDIDLMAQAPPGRDKLTKLYTQEYFFDAIEREVSRANRYQYDLILLMFKIDCLEGFDADQREDIICYLGDSIEDCARNSDIAVRYDSDEFALLLPMTGESESQIPVQRVFLGFTDQLRHAKLDGPYVHSSITALEHGEDHDSLLERALRYENYDNSDSIAP